MKVIIPKLKNCPGMHTRFPPVEPKPADWIEYGLKMAGMDGSIFLLDLSGYSVDFKSRNPTRFLLLREYLDSYRQLNNISKLLEVFYQKEHHGLVRICEIAERVDINLDIVFTPMNYTVSDFKSNADSENLIYLDGLAFDGRGFLYDCAKLISVNELEKLIKESRRGYSFSYVKPLYSARTDLECYLSKTHNPWPGDLDGILWDSERKRVITLLEYKTHNLDSEIKNEASTNYGNEDYRRFMALRVLRDYINRKQASEVCILFIVWGSDPQNPYHSKIKIEKVDSQEWILLPRPIKTKPKKIEFFFSKIMEMI